MSKPSVIVPTPDYYPSLKMGVTSIPLRENLGADVSKPSVIVPTPDYNPSLKMGVLGAMPPNVGVQVFPYGKTWGGEATHIPSPAPQDGGTPSLKFSRKGILLGCAAKRRLRRGEATVLTSASSASVAVYRPWRDC